MLGKLYISRLVKLGTLAFLILFVLSVKLEVHAAPTLQQDENGSYCITSPDDYNTFISDVTGGETYKDCKIILTNDISVEATDLKGSYVFSGNIDGQGHLFDFTANNCYFERSVFPFNPQDGASISNLKLCVHEELHSSKQANKRVFNLTHSLLNCGENSTLDNIEISGNVTLVYDKAKMNITISAISGGNSSTISNCSVNVGFDYDKSNSIDNDEIVNNLSQKGILFNVFYNNSSSGILSIKNCYSGSEYSQNVKELVDTIGNSVTSSDINGGVVKFMWSSPSYGSAENDFYDKERYPEIIDKISSSYAQTVVDNTLSNDASFAKSTADMKLQSTYTGFDFDEIWGISDKLNDGYPFIVAEDVKAVKKLIADLPTQITDADKDAVKAAKDAYDGLTDDQKLQLSADIVQKLNDAVKAIEKEEEPEQNDQEKKPAEQKLKKGTKFTVGTNKYQVTGDKTATFIGAKNKKVKKITVPASVTYKKQTFKVTAIGPKACKGYKKLATFTVGKNVTAIGVQAFANTPKLKKIKVQSMVLKKVGAKACKGMHKKGVIKVPKKMLKKYKKLFKGKGQKKTVKIK